MGRSLVHRVMPVLLAIIVLAPAACALPASPSPDATGPSPSGARFSTAALARLDMSVGRLLRAFEGESAVWIGLPGAADALFAHDADLTFVAASLYKLAVMLEVERLVEQGALRYDDTVTIEDQDVTVDGSYVFPGTTLEIDRALEQMITLSDNGTASALLRKVDARKVNATLATQGIGGFRLAESPDEDHVVTARGVATFFGRLATGKLVSPAASRRMLARLERQTIKDRLPASLPASVRIAHKTGDLVDHRHDAGLLRASRTQPVVVVVLTKNGDARGADSLIAGIAVAAFELMSAPTAP